MFGKNDLLKIVFMIEIPVFKNGTWIQESTSRYSVVCEAQLAFKYRAMIIAHVTPPVPVEKQGDIEVICIRITPVN